MLHAYGITLTHVELVIFEIMSKGVNQQTLQVKLGKLLQNASNFSMRFKLLLF